MNCNQTTFYLGADPRGDAFKRAPRPLLVLTADRATVMMVARSAQSSRSMNECDDRAERIILMRDCMWERAMPVELSPAARQLAGEQEARRLKCQLSHGT